MYHSQEKQDELLDTHIFKGYRRGVFVDVGAWDGVVFSNSLFFERERKWTGIAIEPLPEHYASLVRNRPTCRTYPVAISDREGEGEFLAITGNTGMLSGLRETYDPRHLARIERETAELQTTATPIQVSVRRLDSILRETNTRRVHYLSIDVEGAEMNVLRSIDFAYTFVDVIGIELNYPEARQEISAFLASKGYRQLPFKTTSDSFFLHKDSSFA